jgi:DNA-binding transcriptional ArsR family regulator
MASHSHSKLNWDLSTGYDLFISQLAIYEPDRVGLRASWAAGVRSRLPAEDRQVLEDFWQIDFLPLQFLFSAPAPKDTAAVLRALEEIPAGKRLEALTLRYETPEELKGIFRETTPRRKWTPAEKEIISADYARHSRNMTPTLLDLIHSVWAHREQYGHQYLHALKAYAESFFYEEEQRIWPALRQELSYAQMRAGTLPLIAMLEELSSGVHWEEIAAMQKLYLAPSFWGAPFLFTEDLDKSTKLVIFGARPEEMALIPGDIVPDSLLRGLKALAEPTRLRILRSLAHTPQTAAHLSRMLRLRPPTVNHHLMELRMAGMVQVIISPEGERFYATRFEGFESAWNLLTRFVSE